ncbi:TonB-dependent receptor plug domain-containing protein [Novosphingobium resinovorum]|uniref:TonB-dependent receptor plug domain-containing protein n=1 Tax=Novosphingobium resinovorum TaxID=158500 RepID=UPI003D2E08DE
MTSQRVNGRSNSIAIRGFAPDFSTTLLNGREQTSTGDNRAVEYDQYPSEVVSAVNVYKTPMASSSARAFLAPWTCARSVRSTPASASSRSARAAPMRISAS